MPGKPDRTVTEHAVVQGVVLAKREAPRRLAHDLYDLLHDIAAVAVGGIFP
jgi:hypothetical protein